jgi:hypothetical protein
VVDVSDTYVNTNIVLWANDNWKHSITPGGVGTPSVIFTVNTHCNIYADIASAEAWIAAWQQAVEEAKETERRIAQAQARELLGEPA